MIEMLAKYSVVLLYDCTREAGPSLLGEVNGKVESRPVNRKFTLAHGSSCHREKYIGMSKNIEKKFDAHISKFFVYTTSFIKKPTYFMVCAKKTKKVS